MTTIPLLKADDVALRLNVPRTFVWKLCRTGQLAHVRIGRELRFDALDVEEFIARHKTRRPRPTR